MTEVKPEDLTPLLLVPEDPQEPLQFFYDQEMANIRHQGVAISKDEPLFFTVSTSDAVQFSFIFHKVDGHAANWRACRLIYLITGMVITVTGPVMFYDAPVDRVIHLMKYE